MKQPVIPSTQAAPVLPQDQFQAPVRLAAVQEARLGVDQGQAALFLAKNAQASLLQSLPSSAPWEWEEVALARTLTSVLSCQVFAREATASTRMVLFAVLVPKGSCWTIQEESVLTAMNATRTVNCVAMARVQTRLVDSFALVPLATLQDLLAPAKMLMNAVTSATIAPSGATTPRGLTDVSVPMATSWLQTAGTAGTWMSVGLKQTTASSAARTSSERLPAFAPLGSASWDLRMIAKTSMSVERSQTFVKMDAVLIQREAFSANANLASSPRRTVGSAWTTDGVCAINVVPHWASAVSSLVRWQSAEQSAAALLEGLGETIARAVLVGEVSTTDRCARTQA